MHACTCIRVRKGKFRGFKKNVILLHMIDIEKILSNETQFKALTSLHLDEFETLLKHFGHRWYQYHKHFSILGKRRKYPLSAKGHEKGTTTLRTVESKLLFILMLFKTNAIQQQLAAEFDMDQSHVSRWIKVLLPLLHQAIVDCHCQAAQDMDELIRLFRRRNDDSAGTGGIDTLNADGTARPIGRNTDDEAQKNDFSGKHYGHRIKNTVLCDEYQFIHFAGPTWNGSMHDKTMIEQELPDLSQLESFELWLSKDKGYQSYRPEGVHLLEPIKATRGKQLTSFEKEYNQWVNSIRTVVEHAIGGVKRLALLAQPMRYWKHSFRHQFFQIGCGLHNLRVRFRIHAYARGALRVRAKLNF